MTKYSQCIEFRIRIGHFSDYESFILYPCRPAVVRRSAGEERGERREERGEEGGGEREAIGARAFSVLAGDCERRRGVSVATRWRCIATDPHHHSYPQTSGHSVSSVGVRTWCASGVRVRRGGRGRDRQIDGVSERWWQR